MFSTIMNCLPESGQVKVAQVNEL